MSSGKDRLFEIINTIRKYDLIKNMSAERLRLAIEELGPTFIKLGQILSYRDDVIPKEYCEELSHLRNQVKPMEFEKVMEIFRDYLDSDQEEEVLKCRRGYLRVTWNGDSRYCVDGILCRTPEELFEVLLSDYRSYEEIQITKGRREVTEDDEKLAEQFCQRLRKRWEEETK